MGGHFLRFQKCTSTQSCFFYLCFLTMDQDVSAETRGISLACGTKRLSSLLIVPPDITPQNKAKVVNKWIY